MPMRPAMIAALLAMGLFLSPAQAQTAPEQASPLAAAPASDASLSHSVLKAITYKAGTTAANMTIYSIAAGSLAVGTALTAFGTAASLAIYTANDYLWDKHLAPPAKRAQGQPFDLKDEFTRTTEKFLTWNASILWIKGVKAASLYAYTGSTTTTVAAVSAATVVVAGIFYANNFAWDYYDSLAAPPPDLSPPTPEAVPTAQAPALPQAAALPEHEPKS